MEAPKINSQALSILRNSIIENPLLSVVLGAAIASVATFIFTQLARPSYSYAGLNKKVTDETNKKAEDLETPVALGSTTETEEQNETEEQIEAGVNLQAGQGSEEMESSDGNVGDEDQLPAQDAATDLPQGGSDSDGDFE